LIACGIVLAAALVFVTGLVADYLRQQTLASSEAGISELDAVLAQAANRSLLAVDAVLDDISARLRLADATSSGGISRQMTLPEIVVPVAQRIEAAPTIGGVALIDADGRVVNTVGFWPQVERTAATRDYFVALQTRPELDSFIGAPIGGGDVRGPVIPVARKLRDMSGGFAGIAVVALPADEFADFYRAVPLDGDEAIALVRRDGVVLTGHAGGDGSILTVAGDARLAAMIGEGRQGIEDKRGATGKWRISAVHPLADYPLAVVVSRDGDAALVPWSRQAAMFAAFALCGVATIGLMVVLIGRQIHTHNMLAAMRAEKIEGEHARLVAEAELLKKERLSVLGQFTARVADELRNPLAAIRNTLFTMREIATTSGLPLDRPIARIQRSIARCDRIIGDLLEYIRAPELNRVLVRLDDWLREVVAEHALPPLATLVTEFQAPHAVVRIDPDRIRRVVVNLIENAVQALGEVLPGSGPSCIVVKSAAGADGAVELIVADTGPGIPPESMERIFEPLFSTKSFGAGLGLSTVKQIVVQHNGSVSVKSRLGVGTQVTVRLPLEQTLRIAA